MKNSGWKLILTILAYAVFNLWDRQGVLYFGCVGDQDRLSLANSAANCTAGAVVGKVILDLNAGQVSSSVSSTSG